MSTVTLLSLAPANVWAQVALIIIGIAAVLKSADWLTCGAVGLATRIGVPQIVIGLTIVAIGTSMPEFCVSLASAIGGTPDLAVGNIVGSNIFNTLLIVGVAAIVAPIAITRPTIRRDVPVAIGASLLLTLMVLDGEVSRIDASILFALFIIYMYITLRGTRKTSDDRPSESHPMGTGKAVVLMAAGLAGLIIGSNVFVENASAFAGSLGVSDAIIGLTIVAGGTSLPELATSVVAARKGESGIAIGNVLGSNVFNILMILGITGVVSPMRIEGITTVDFSIMVASVLALWLFSFTKLRVERWEGIMLATVFAMYVGWLVVNV